MVSDEDNKRRRENSSTDSDDFTEFTDENEMHNAGKEKIKRKKKTVDSTTTKTGGVSITYTDFWQTHAENSYKNDKAYQRITWEALKISIQDLVDKVNVRNVRPTTIKLLRLNIIRGRGLLTQSIIQAQAALPGFTKVYAASMAVINTQFPIIGELLLTRLVLRFKHEYENDKKVCISSAKFIAQLFNQKVAHEILIIDIIESLLDNPTDHSIEVATTVLNECGTKLQKVFKKGTKAIFRILKKFLYGGKLELSTRVQYKMKAIFKKQKDNFGLEFVPKKLDLVEAENQSTHEIQLDQSLDDEEMLNDFQFDDNYRVNENKYKELLERILSSVSDSDDEEINEDEVKNNGIVIDETGSNPTAFRRKIYLIIHSSLSFEECAHKLKKMQLKPDDEIDLCHMILDCCEQMRIYDKIFGLLAERLCASNTYYVKGFESCFKETYNIVHRLDTNHLKNIAKFFAFMFNTDSVSWSVLSNIKLNEEDTTSSGRVFIKILFQELSYQMGLPKLNMKLKTDRSLQESFSTPFAVNFFTMIGLGGLTDNLREHLENTQTNGREDSAAAL